MWGMHFNKETSNKKYMTPPPTCSLTPPLSSSGLSFKVIYLWNETSTTCLVGEVSFYSSWFNFIQSQFDSSLLLRKIAIRIVALLVYMNAIVITRSNSQLIEQLKAHLYTSFHKKNLDTLQYFLGKVVRLVHYCNDTSTLKSFSP